MMLPFSLRYLPIRRQRLPPNPADDEAGRRTGRTGGRPLEPTIAAGTTTRRLAVAVVGQRYPTLPLPVGDEEDQGTRAAMPEQTLTSSRTVEEQPRVEDRQRTACDKLQRTKRKGRDGDREMATPDPSMARA